MAYSTGTLTGTYLTQDGTAAKGYVTIRPSAPVARDQAGDVILSGSVKVPLNADGSFSVDLPASDDVSLDPSGVTFAVTASLHHGLLATVVGVFIAAGESVDMADLMSVDPAAPSYQEQVNEATASASAAAASATAAQTSSDAAASSAVSAAGSAADAVSAALEAAASATDAEASNEGSEEARAAVALSEANAADSAAAASSSAAAGAQSATDADASADAAAASATSAQTSATNAAGGATAAQGSATSAATSVTAAQGSATTAAASASSAQAAQTAAEAARDAALARDPLRYDATRLRAFRAALGAREAAPVDILCIGDSVTEGQGSSAQANRWQQRLQARLRATHQPAGVVGGEGYVASFFVSSGMTDRSVQTIATMTAREDLGGLGERTITLTGTNASETFTFTGTGVDILYSKGTTAGDFTWKIDAGSETTVSAFNAVISGGNVVQIRGLAAASHTLTIRRVTSTTYIEGYMVYNGDETKGIRTWDAGHSGTQSDDLATPNGISWFDSITPVQPDLVTLFLGLNDYGSATQTRLTPAQMKTNLQSILTQVRAKCTVAPSVLLVIPYERALPGGTLLAPWADYRTAITEVAQGDGNIALLDLATSMGSFLGSVDPYDLDNGDFLHPNDRGHQLIADAIYDVVTRA